MKELLIKNKVDSIISDIYTEEKKSFNQKLNNFGKNRNLVNKNNNIKFTEIINHNKKKMPESKNINNDKKYDNNSIINISIFSNKENNDRIDNSTNNEQKRRKRS